MRHPRTWWRGRRARRSARWPAQCSRATGSAGRGSSASRPRRWSRVRAPGRTGLRIRVVRGTSGAVRSRSRRSSERPSSARAPVQSPRARAPFDLIAQLRTSPIVRSTVAASSRHVRPRAETRARSDPCGSLLAATPDPARRAGGGGSSRPSVRSPGSCARWSGDSPGPVAGRTLRIASLRWTGCQPGARTTPDALLSGCAVFAAIARIAPSIPSPRDNGRSMARAEFGTSVRCTGRRDVQRVRRQCSTELQYGRCWLAQSPRLYHWRTVITGPNPPP